MSLIVDPNQLILKLILAKVMKLPRQRMLARLKIDSLRKKIGFVVLGFFLPELVAGLRCWNWFKILAFSAVLILLKFLALFAFDYFVPWRWSWAIAITAYLFICLTAAIVVVSIPNEATTRRGSLYWVGVFFLTIGSSLLYFQYRSESAFSRYKIYRVPSESMLPNIMPGDAIVIDKFAYESDAPKLGDVIVFNHHLSGKALVKRVVGLSGQNVTTENLLMRVPRYAEKILSETPYPPYDSESDGKLRDLLEIETDLQGVTYRLLINKHAANGPFYRRSSSLVGSNQIFVLGDNRSASRDSRRFGPVNINEVVGKVKGVAYSLGKHLKFRNERIGLNIYLEP
ncbi:signal peptidase I [Oligoflexaceae bacterium]|nr:signal peptidase I [Oligoflexaceae bacterium]